MKKSSAILVLVILLMVTVIPASASWSWCSNDPEVVLPNGQGSLHVWVSVPEDFAGQPVTVHLMVPKGSRVINHAGEANLQVITHFLPQNARSVAAGVNEEFPIRLSAFHNQQELRTFTFERGNGVGVWHW